MSKFAKYILDCTDVGGIGYCNGYPVFTLKSDSSHCQSAPLNKVLVGKDNLLSIKITALGDDPMLNFMVQKADGDMVVSTDGCDEIDLSGELPIDVKLVFDSPQSGFAALLETVQPSDIETMTAYALKVRDTINSRDSAAITALFEKKFLKQAEEMGWDMDTERQKITNVVEELVRTGIELKDEAAAPEPCCGDKLWRLKRKDGNDLVYIKEVNHDGLIYMMEEDGSMSIELTAGLTADGPAIVL